MIDFAAFISSISVASDIAKGLQSIHNEEQIFEATSDLRKRILDIQGSALTLQENHFSLLQQKTDLEKRLLEYEKWEDTASQYALKKLAARSFVYVPNESNKSPKPMHYLCAKCYGDRKKSILQTIYVGMGGDRLFCPECKTRFQAEAEDIRALDT